MDCGGDEAPGGYDFVSPLGNFGKFCRLYVAPLLKKGETFALKMNFF